MQRRLGNLERQLFAYSQMSRQRELRTGDLTSPLGISAKQERELLTRLAKSKMIAKVRRGLYLVPPRLPLGVRWTPDEAMVLTALLSDKNGCYQVCGPNAFNRYRFDNQIPNRVYAYNNRFSERRTVGAVTLELIKVADERLGDTEEMRTAEGDTIVYSSRVRTLLDAVYDWSRFDTLPRAYAWIRSDLESRRVSAADLVRVTVEYGNQTTIRRMGCLLERAGVAARLIRKLEAVLDPPTNFIPWVPRGPRSGERDRRWGVLINAPA